MCGCSAISVLSQKAQSQDLRVTTSLGLQFCKAEILSLSWKLQVSSEQAVS